MPATKAPALELPSTDGGIFDLSAARGTPVVVFFYPKDNTSGCMQEGVAFADLHDAFRRAGAEVVGVSPDSLASHEKFRTKMGFPFELLSDEDHKACTLFDVWKEKSMYGRKYMGVERSTFLIDEQGALLREWRKVKVSGHADEVLDVVRDL